jgi:ABC-type antimicrobial peptide transport system permease subunit
VRIGVREGLLAHAMRTLLTMLGIVIAVAGVIAMSSFSLGSKRKQADQIKALGVNLVRVVDGQLEGQKLADARIAGSQGLSLRDLERLQANVPDIARAAAVRFIKLNLANTLDGVAANTLAVSGDYLAVNNLSVAEGRFLNGEDAARSARTAVVGRAIAERLRREAPGPILGRTLVMGATPYTVVGVLADRDVDLKGLEATGARDANYDILLPLETVLTRTRSLDMRSQVDELHLQIGVDERLFDAGMAIRRVLHAAHGGVEDFRLVVPLELLKQKEQAQRLLDVLTLCIASIALVVGGIGIMNIMLASVTERTREIGVRRAVGATERDILWQFLSESVLISATGGLLGLALAVVVVVVAGTALQLPVVFSAGMVVVAIGAAVATGLGFGLYPALQAARKNPVEALRYE